MRGIIFDLLLTIKDKAGKVSTRNEKCDTERQADERQLELMLEIENEGGEITDAKLTRSRR